MCETEKSVHTTAVFVETLLEIFNKGAAVSGGQHGRLVKSRLGEITGHKQEHGLRYALYARAALGSDNGNYMRADVLPLVSSTENPDARYSNMSTDATRADASCRAGLLSALQSQLETDIDSLTNDLADIAGTIGWLLTMNEISDHVRAYLKRVGASGALQIVEHVCLENDIGGVLAEKEQFEWFRKNGQEAINLKPILESLLVVLAQPLDHIEKQRRRTANGGLTSVHRTRLG